MIPDLLSQVKNEIDRSNREISLSWPYHILRLLLYTGIMLAGLGVAYYYTRRVGLNFSNNWLLLSGIVIGGVLSLEMLVRWPALAMISLIPFLFFVGGFMPTGTLAYIDISVHAVAALLGIWFLHMLLVKRSFRLAPVRLNIPALAFVAAASLALVLGNQRYGEAAAGGASLLAQLGGWVLLVFPVLLMLASGSLSGNTKLIKSMFFLFSVCGAFFIGEILLARWTGSHTLPVPPRAISSIYWTLMLALPAGQVMFNPSLGMKWRIVFVALILFTVTGSLQLADKLANWAPLLVALFILLWLRNWRWGLALTVVGFLLALPVLVWKFYLPATLAWSDLTWPWPYSGIINRDSEFSINSRLATWPIMFKLVKQSPLFGLGPANYRFFTNQFRFWVYFLPFNSHNNYWDLVAQTGLVGLGLFAWLAGELICLARRLRKQVNDGFSQGYAAGMLAGFAGVLAAGMMNDYFMPFVYNVGFAGFRPAAFIWLFLGGLIGLETIRKKTADAETR